MTNARTTALSGLLALTLGGCAVSTGATREERMTAREPLRMQSDATGEGTPLVLVGGGLTGWESWQPFLPRLRGRRVIRMQPLNVQYGLEDRPLPEGYGVEMESAALAAALEKEGGPLDIVAWSYGALATLDFALDHPERVRRLVLIEPPALWTLPEQGRRHEAVRRLEARFPDSRAEVSEDMLAAFLEIAGFVPPGGDPRTLPPWSNWVRFRRSLRNTPAVHAHVDDIARLRTLERPVLLPTGTGTSPFLREITTVLDGALPDSRVIEMPAGHAPHIVSMDRFLVELDRFLSTPPSLAAKLGSKVAIEGTARDAKGGAVVLIAPGEEPVYLEGVARWPDALSGRRVAVEGTLHRKKLLPDPGVEPRTAGAEGDQLVLESPTWTAR